MSAEPAGELRPAQLEALHDGNATGMLVGGTLTQLMASMGTPWAFDPPAGLPSCSSKTSVSARIAFIGC